MGRGDATKRGPWVRVSYASCRGSCAGCGDATVLNNPHRCGLSRRRELPLTIILGSPHTRCCILTPQTATVAVCGSPPARQAMHLATRLDRYARSWILGTALCFLMYALWYRRLHPYIRSSRPTIRGGAGVSSLSSAAPRPVASVRPPESLPCRGGAGHPLRAPRPSQAILAAPLWRAGSSPPGRR